VSESRIEGLLCPELDIALFCQRITSQDPMEIMDASGMECALLRREHLQRTGRPDFRLGSRRYRYCQDQQHLISMLLNGSVPEQADERFLLSTSMLVRRLLLKWRIGNLQDVYSPESLEQCVARAAEQDPLLTIILEAREAGRRAARALLEEWRATHGEKEQYDYLAGALLHLTVRRNSKIATSLFHLASHYPPVLRVDRGFSPGITVSILNMTNSLEQGLNIAAEEAALEVLSTRLRVSGYVSSHAS
jgi:hypothetical protein